MKGRCAHHRRAMIAGREDAGRVKEGGESPFIATGMAVGWPCRLHRPLPTLAHAAYSIVLTGIASRQHRASASYALHVLMPRIAKCSRGTRHSPAPSASYALHLPMPRIAKCSRGTVNRRTLPLLPTLRMLMPRTAKLPTLSMALRSCSVQRSSHGICAQKRAAAGANLHGAQLVLAAICRCCAVPPRPAACLCFLRLLECRVQQTARGTRTLNGAAAA